MYAYEAAAVIFRGFCKVVEIGPAVPAAGGTIAVFVKRPVLEFVYSASKFHSPM